MLQYDKVVMNIYLCSTVRNLLFAQLKALDEPGQKSCILMIYDQQNISIDNYDLSSLPDHVQVKFIRRKDIRKQLDRRLSGRILRLLAVLNIRTGVQFRRRIKTWLFNDLLKNLGLVAAEVGQLFLFNDRNRVARLLRLAFADYAIIEDGLSNYSGKKLRAGEALWHVLTGNRSKKSYLGDDKRCHTIFLLNPKSSPEVLRSKVRPVTFIDSRNIAEVCCNFFRFQPVAGRGSVFSTILATQPIAVGQLTASGFDLVIYRKLLAQLQAKGAQVALKVHPREDLERYRQAFPDYQLVESKIPLELMIFGAEDKCDIVSIYSSAGMGFEQYCRRLTLIKDQESEQMQAVFDAWRKNADSLERRINALLQ